MDVERSWIPDLTTKCWVKYDTRAAGEASEKKVREIDRWGVK
jgi:hypothetical protein